MYYRKSLFSLSVENIQLLLVIHTYTFTNLIIIQSMKKYILNRERVSDLIKQSIGK